MLVAALLLSPSFLPSSRLFSSAATPRTMPPNMCVMDDAEKWIADNAGKIDNKNGVMGAADGRLA